MPTTPAAQRIVLLAAERSVGDLLQPGIAEQFSRCLSSQKVCVFKHESIVHSSSDNS